MNPPPTTIQAPDTVMARRFVELQTAQRERQRRIQHLFLSTSPAARATTTTNHNYDYFSPNPSNESHLVNDDAVATAAMSFEIITPCQLEFEFDKDTTPSGADIFNSLTLDNMIAGSAGTATYSSREIH